MQVTFVWDEKDEEGYAYDGSVGPLEIDVLPQEGDWMDIDDTDRSWLVQAVVWRLTAIREDDPVPNHRGSVIVGYKASVEVWLKEPPD